MQCAHLQSAAPLPKLQMRRARWQNLTPSHPRPSVSRTIGSILIAAALLCSVEVRAMAESTVTFEADAVGGTPKGWTATKTGRGDPRWTIEQDQTAPSKSKIVKQSGTATYPLLLEDDTQIQDGRPLLVPRIAQPASPGGPEMRITIMWSAPTLSRT